MKKKFIAWIVTICIIGGGVVSGSFFAFNKTPVCQAHDKKIYNFF